MDSTTTTSTFTVSGHGAVDLTVTTHGHGRPILLLHGGAGPQSVDAIARSLADSEKAQVIVPTHPGFGGTVRPAWLDGMGGLAALYGELLDRLGLTGVVVVGNSIGGWVAAELAIVSGTRLGGLVLVDAVGIEVDGQPVADIFPLTMDQLADLSYHDPEPYRIDVAGFSDAQRAVMAGNRASLRTYGGAMGDPGLRARLSAVAVPTLVVWGDSDRICTPDYGRAYADAIPGARFALLADTGHVPQIENPGALLALVASFVAPVSSPS